MKERAKYGVLYTLPLALWIGLFFMIPTFIVFIYSFLEKDTYGGVKWQFSGEAYAIVFNKTFLQITATTVYISVLVTFITLILAIPTAYYIARSKYKNLLLLLVVIPFWTNFLVRIYAWIAIMGNNGLLNNFLKQLGLVKDYIQFLYNPWAVILITAYTFLPYAILPLYSTIEKFDFSLIEAARDLGANNYTAHMKIFLPAIKSGIVTAIIFTFIPTLGSYAIPKLVGGKKALMLGNVIARELTVTRNWPLASAVSVMLMGITSIGIVIFMNMNKRKELVD